MSARIAKPHRPGTCRWSVPACRFDMLSDDDNALESIWLCERGAVPVVTAPATCRTCAHWEAEPKRRASGRNKSRAVTKL